MTFLAIHVDQLILYSISHSNICIVLRRQSQFLVKSSWLIEINSFNWMIITLVLSSFLFKFAHH